MVFLVDKYKTDKLSKVICHKHIYRSLFNGYKNKDSLTEWEKYPSTENTIKQISNINTKKELCNFTRDHFKIGNLSINEYKQRYVQMPNLLIYGPNGSGKKTLINLLLEDIYDIKVHDIKKVTYQITGYGNSVNDVELDQSNYHIIIEPTNTGLDKYLIHEIVKNYAQETTLNVYDCNTPFRIVFINNIDNLSYYAQTSLRYTMEKYHKTCKFILCGYQLSKIIEPLRSRCLNIRIPGPSIKDTYNIIFDISCREMIEIDEKNMYKIAILANGNIKKAMSLLEMYSIGIRNYSLSWKRSIKDIINIILEFNNNPTDATFNERQILNIRTILYLIYVSGINESQMITEFTKCYMLNSKAIDPKLNIILIQLIGYYDTRITKGTRFIIHLETLIMTMLYHMKAFIEKK